MQSPASLPFVCFTLQRCSACLPGVAWVPNPTPSALRFWLMFDERPFPVWLPANQQLCCLSPLQPGPCSALQLDTDGRLMLTGSSDHTIRLWDLGQQRCVQTLAVHTDSVWALWASPSFATVYSGGRDGCIYR